MRRLICILRGHYWIVAPPGYGWRHCQRCGKFEAFELAEPTYETPLHPVGMFDRHVALRSRH
jgi:hypothetical protein